MRDECRLTDRALPRGPRPPAFGIAGVAAEPPMPPEQLAALVACPAGLDRIIGRPIGAARGAEYDMSKPFGRDRPVAPRAFPALPFRDPLRAGLGHLERGSAPGIAVFPADGAALGQVSTAPLARQPMRAAILITLVSSACRILVSHEL